MTYTLDLTSHENPELAVDVRDAFCLYTVPDGALAALRGLTLGVSKGERVVVQGPNGSGKTTLLKVLMGEQALSAGRALVAGREVVVGPGGHDADELSAWRATRLGWVDQMPARTLRPELSVLANVTLQQRLSGVARAHAREAAADLMTRLGVAGLGNRSPLSLSGGEAQRVAICAALAHRPTLVLADEPCGQLDAATAQRVYDALAEAVDATGAALVLVSHDQHAARIADRVVRIRDGRLSESWLPGTEGELLVVDDRGWVRLPEALRKQAGAPQALTARLGRDDEDGAGGIVLTPAEPPAEGLAGAAGAGGPGVAPAACDPPRRIARLRGVRIALDDVEVLTGLDLDVHRGRLLVVRGRSGSGKSTVLRLLVGLQRPDAGTVLVDGTDLADLDRTGLADLRRRLTAVVGQDVHLAETVGARTNIELARAVRAGPGRAGPTFEGPDALHTVGLARLGDRPVEQLSGGERQRVAVARALSVGARLVVLDEPTSQLDEASAEHLARALVVAARAGAAVVAATHDPVLVAAADVVLDLEGLSS